MGEPAFPMSLPDEDQVFKKCMWRLIPFMVLLFTLNFLDRVNVGFAALTMNKDLGLSPSAFGFSAGIFFLGYAMFAIPSSVFIERVGARRGVFCIMAAWGILSASCAFVRNANSFYVLRFLLGMAEAGFNPGMLAYLGLWFPQKYRASAIALFYLGGPLSNIIGGPISGALLGVDNVGGLRGWEWMFLIEGLPAFFLSFAALKLLPNGPNDASWLNSGEKYVVARCLTAEPPADHRDLWSALGDPRVYAFGIAGLGIALSAYGFDFWLPQIIQPMGFSNLAIGFIVAAIFSVGFAAQMLSARSSDGSGERVWHIALPALFAAAAWIGFGFVSWFPLALLILTAVRAGVNATYGPILSMPFSFLRGPAVAGGMALNSVLVGLGGFIGPVAIGILKEATGSYASGMAFLACGLMMSAVIVLWLGRAITPHTPALALKVSSGE